MHAEVDTRQVYEEQGQFQTATPLQCEACSACGLCDISSGKVDFMGNISDLSAVDDAQKPQVQILFKMAGFEQKLQNWDESVGDKGRFEFTRFGRTFKGELSRYGDITLHVELVQPTQEVSELSANTATVNTSITEEKSANMNISEQMEPVSHEKHTSQIHVVQPETDTTTNKDSNRITTFTDSMDSSNEQKNITLVDDTYIYVEPLSQETIAKDMAETSVTERILKTEKSLTVLPNEIEYMQWQQEAPSDDWEILPVYIEVPTIQPLIYLGKNIMHDALPTDIEVETPQLEQYSYDKAIPDIFDHIETSTVNEQINVQSEDIHIMVETHKQAERDMFTFVTEIYEMIKQHVPEQTELMKPITSEEVAQAEEQSLETQQPSTGHPLVFKPSNQSEHVLIQYLIAAKARMESASGSIEFTKEVASKPDISEQKHMYIFPHGETTFEITVITQPDKSIEIHGTIEALRVLAITLLELQLAQKRSEHHKDIQVKDSETAQEELVPTRSGNTNVYNIDQYIYILIYQFIIVLESEIENTVVLHLCIFA